jgi:zinc/manganese transport system substrate-binding protein
VTGDGAVTVVATHSILGDLVANVAGDGVTVETVMPIGADPHEFEASAQQIEAMNAADLLVTNGLGFEEQLGEAIEAAEADGVAVLELGENLDPIPFADEHGHAEDEEEHAEEGEHAAGADDPHWFQDPDRAAEAVRLVGTRITEVTGDDGATERAEAYATELEDLAVDMEGTLESVSRDRRKLVTNHGAFGYFADRFEFEVIGTVIPSGTTLAEPSAAELQELAEAIEHENVPAIFAENIQPEELADALAGEVDVDVEVVELYSDSLGEEGSDGATYVEMLRSNAERIAGALAG